MVKCAHCNKLITKKTPGLECNKCGGVVHASTVCTQLSGKQLNLLRVAENLEWTCTECSANTPRRSSFVIPEDDAAEEDDDEIITNLSNYPFDAKKLVADISTQMNKIIKQELKGTNQALQFTSDKLDNCLESIEAFKEKIIHLEKKNIDLINTNKHLERRLEAQEQRMQEIEQNKFKKVLEIQGIPSSDKENLHNITKNLASALQVSETDVKNIKRIPTKQGKPGVLHIKLKTEDIKTEWLNTARTTEVVFSNIIYDCDPIFKNNKIFIRQALTHYQKNLLWKAKQELKDKYKYIWCKEGKILTRKTDNSKIVIIRSEKDIHNLSSF